MLLGIIKLCFLNLFVIASALAQTAITPDRWGQNVNKVYLESNTIKEFIKSLPMSAKDKVDLREGVELNNLAAAPLPVMQVELDSKTTTYYFSTQMVRLQWKIAENIFLLNGKSVNFNSSMKYKELHRNIKKILSQSSSAEWPRWLLPEAEAGILGDLAIIAIVGAIMKGIEYQMTCDTLKDSLCFVGLSPDVVKGIEVPPKNLAQSFWSGHLPNVFQCNDKDMPVKVAATFPFSIKGMKGGPVDYVGRRPREIELNYIDGKLNSFNINIPACHYKVAKDGNMVVHTIGEKKCQVPFKMPARQFLAYAGLWLSDAEDCCKSSCKNEVQKMISEQSRLPQPDSSGVGI